MIRDLLVMMRLLLFSKYSVDISCSLNSFSRVCPSSSLPIRENMETLPPSAFTFNATLAAPPSLCSFFLSATMGTGASGEMRSTLPHQYVSSITSPITPAFISENFLNSFLKSSLAIASGSAFFNSDRNIIQRNASQRYYCAPNGICRLCPYQPNTKCKGKQYVEYRKN